MLPRKQRKQKAKPKKTKGYCVIRCLAYLFTNPTNPGCSIDQQRALILHTIEMIHGLWLAFVRRSVFMTCSSFTGCFKKRTQPLEIKISLFKHKICSSWEFKIVENSIKENNDTTCTTSPCIKFHSIVFMHHGFGAILSHLNYNNRWISKVAVFETPCIKMYTPSNSN